MWRVLSSQNRIERRGSICCAAGLLMLLGDVRRIIGFATREARGYGEHPNLVRCDRELGPPCQCSAILTGLVSH